MKETVFFQYKKEIQEWNTIQEWNIIQESSNTRMKETVFVFYFVF